MALPGLGPEFSPRNPRVVSWGELLWDLFPDRILLGGSAANVAYHCAMLGAESWLVSAVGSDALGRQALDHLRRAGVSTQGISVDAKAATGCVRVTFSGGEPQFVVEEGVAWDKIDPTQEVLDAIFASDVFCFSTLAQRTPLMRSRLRTILRELHRRGPVAPFGGARARRPLCVLDLNLRPPFTDPSAIHETLRYADVVKVNEAEEIWVREMAGGDAVNWLLETFPTRVVAVTRAEKGASLYTRGLSIHAAGLPQLGGDAVGAGDAFVAALSVSLACGFSLPRCLELANRLGSWVAGQAGAMPPYFGPRLDPTAARRNRSATA
jgi:fructokinase